MGKNVVFYFSGTGNSLLVAQKIKANLMDCDIVPMGINVGYNLDAQYDTIGFVYPTYFQGLPHIVTKFIKKIQLNKQKDAYVYAIATCGGSSGNALNQAKSIIESNGGKLDYGAQIKMYANYVALYDMKANVLEITEKSNTQIVIAITHIKNKTCNDIGKENPMVKFVYEKFIKSVKEKDKNFNLSDKCSSCGICSKVCPVGNVTLVNGKPTFKHKCEQCMACIQYCSKKAINYKNKTQNRGRYVNPSIDSSTIAEYNKNIK